MAIPSYVRSERAVNDAEMSAPVTIESRPIAGWLVTRLEALIFE